MSRLEVEGVLRRKLELKGLFWCLRLFLGLRLQVAEMRLIGYLEMKVVVELQMGELRVADSQLAAGKG